MNPVQSSEFLTGNGYRLHLRRIAPEARDGHQAVLMIHGAIENGRIFYSHKGQGLAPYLARQGLDVYVLDLRGRGLSRPTIRRGHQYGQHESIVEDIPKAISHLQQRYASPLRTLAHSWGGVMLMASLLRFPELAQGISRQVMFGTKRRIRVRNMERLFKLELIWHRLGPLVSRLVGYFPARDLKIGADNETANYLRGVSEWVRKDAWKEPCDGFDYHQVLERAALPRTWFITGRADKVLGHADDMLLFARECGFDREDCTTLSRAGGYQHDYDHINILTHRDCEADHFPQVARWLAASSVDCRVA
ncbi:hypothetical protein HMF8227_00913 [Saliniradius amylolyticus]|uniref:Serine aminopeptidase S33 domain-containing protein n=1 Tax=Saliniradius amylolyticus TaxID=2183582 RepID=A0A2S2E183_9ALTE|nr:alpha/beta fold hydrolase [Saliniradius amylolyticus]AWL11408.1 hypothetical protein HMF8227_00913 [Saliniradius amylolyticus]